MKIETNPYELQNTIKKIKSNGSGSAAKIVLVPTMGALHEGHLKLIDKAKTLGDYVVVSIFVNPIQFGPNEDFAKYPREFDNDCKKCEERGADFVFAPSVNEMYPSGFDTKVVCGKITSVLEGAIRPGHFDGVCSVVLKLFNITLADVAVFGQKDAQQVMVIKQMVRDLNVPITIDIHSIVREKSGLAMSSRNAYLTSKEKEDVPMIFSGLQAVADFVKTEKSAKKIKKYLEKFYSAMKFFKVEYIAITDLFANEINEVSEKNTLISLAVRTTQSKTRLIDNIIL